MFCCCSDTNNTTLDVSQCANPGCQEVVHMTCHELNPSLFPYFECPSCLLKYSDPRFPVVKVLQSAIRLYNSMDELEFEINNLDYQHLKGSDNVYIALRCIKFSNEASTVHYDTWPSQGSLMLNSTKILFKDLIDTNSKRQVFRRALFRQEVHEANNLSFELDINDDEHYYFGIYLVNTLNFEILRDKIKGGTRMSIDESKKFIQENFQPRKNQKSVTVSLADEQGELMETPVRAKGCKHITCFSLENFIRNQLNLTSKRWTCPICKNRAYHLVVDEYFVKIISKYSGKKLFKYNVTFYRNGTFEVSSGISKGNTMVNAIEVEDTPEPSDSLGKILNVMKEAVNKYMDPQLDLSILTVPSFKSIKSMCYESGENGIITVKELHEIVMNLFDPLAFHRKNGGGMEVEVDKPEAELNKIKAFFKSFLCVTESVLKDLSNFKEALTVFDTYASKFEANFSLELSLFYTIKALLENFRFVSISRKQFIEMIEQKSALTPNEKIIVGLHTNWMTFYGNKIDRTSFVSRNIESEVKSDYKEFPLELMKGAGPERLNWALNRVLCVRKGLWRISWSFDERWYRVELLYGHKSGIVVSKDPFAGMLENDIDMVMDEVLYLKECWKYEMKQKREIGLVGSNYNNLITTNEGPIMILKPSVDAEITDFLQNDFVSDKYIKLLETEVSFKTMKREGDLAIKKFVKEFEIDTM